MNKITPGSVDMIFSDLPYSQTRNKWDRALPLPELWESFRRVLKPSGAIVLTASQPFTSQLVMSNPKDFRVEWIWRKNYATGHQNVKRMPMKQHESVLVFGKPGVLYNPQGLQPFNKVTRRGSNGSNYGRSGKENFQKWTNYPRTVLEFASDTEKLHPTQKPLALVEYFVKTYSNEGDLVLDCCMGSGTTAVACLRTGRRFIGFETDAEYYRVAMLRIDAERPRAGMAA